MSRTTVHGGAFARMLALIALLVFIGAVAYGVYDVNRFSQAPLTVSGPGESLDIARGTRFTSIVQALRQRGMTQANAVYWRVLAEQMRLAGKLHAGEYAISPGLTPRQLLLNMAGGKVLQRNFTIVDGWTFAQLRDALAHADMLDHDSAGLDDATLMKKISAMGEAPEGRFLPETYAYVKGDTELDILKRAHAAMTRTLDTLWLRRDKGLPLATAYDALILASIVEKETGRADERPRIAGVFVRRLEDHMMLQTDPSVIYGMGTQYTGTIHKNDLTTDTPYNSYTRAGLPPTPIELPGKPALLAVMHPAEGNELYFVARGDGGHVFASTLEAHNRNVDCYQRKHCQ